jgi:hypothetical protein
MPASRGYDSTAACSSRCQNGARTPATGGPPHRSGTSAGGPQPDRLGVTVAGQVIRPGEIGRRVCDLMAVSIQHGQGHSAQKPDQRSQVACRRRAIRKCWYRRLLPMTADETALPGADDA